MVINTAETVIGIVGGAVGSEFLRKVIAEAEIVLSFKSVYKELASTVEALLPILKDIESMQKEEDLRSLIVTIGKASVLVRKCSDVPWWNIFFKSYYSRKINKINRKMFKFCQVQLQLINHRNILRISDPAPVSTVLCSVPKPDEDPIAPVPRDLCSVRKPDKDPIGLNRPLMNLKKKLLDDSVHTLLVSAPGGCGKTTLVTQLYHDAEIKGMFTHTFFCVVSSTPNFRLIVQSLLQQNGLPHTLENDAQAHNDLGNLLEKLKESGDILLVLDDVWPGAESLLEYFRINIPGYKILVTSRVDLPGFDSTYNLEPLEDKYAKPLLIECASRPDHVSQAEYDELLQKILKRCNGFPLVIKVVGASLKNRSLNQWKGQVVSWSIGGTVFDEPHLSVLHRLQTSFDDLNTHLHQCFLDMGSFLEDQRIHASVIVDIWVELYGDSIIRPTTEKDKNILYMKYLEDLANYNLLDLAPIMGIGEHEDGFNNDFIVTQHDILRELAILQSKKEAVLTRKRLNLEIRLNKFPEWCSNPGPVIINASVLSISTDDTFSSTWVHMDCPNVEALVLHIYSPDYVLPEFIEGMKKLKTLTIINHGVHPSRLSKLSCLSSLPNLKQITMEEVSITLLDILELLLHSLKKLTLFKCPLGKVSHDTKETDVAAALSSLQEINLDCCSDFDELPNWISEVVSLKTLSITNCTSLKKLPEAIGDLSVLEVLRLNACIGLVELPETTTELSNLQFLDISNCFQLRKLPLEIGNLQKLKKISMRKCWTCELPGSITKLENLEVKCDEGTRVLLWESLKPKMTNLEVREEETEHNLKMFNRFLYTSVSEG